MFLSETCLMNFPPSLAFISGDFLFLAMRSAIPMFRSALNYSALLFLTLGIVRIRRHALLRCWWKLFLVEMGIQHRQPRLLPTTLSFSSSSAKCHPFKLLCSWVASNPPVPSSYVVLLAHRQRKFIWYSCPYPGHGHLWEQAGFNGLLLRNSSFRTSLQGTALCLQEILSVSIFP